MDKTFKPGFPHLEGGNASLSNRNPSMATSKEFANTIGGTPDPNHPFNISKSKWKPAASTKSNKSSKSKVNFKDQKSRGSKKSQNKVQDHIQAHIRSDTVGSHDSNYVSEPHAQQQPSVRLSNHI